jgi:hypothetical protein
MAKKRVRRSGAAADVSAEISNPENFVDGLGVRAECALCGAFTDGGAVVRATGVKVSLCPDHRDPEGLAEALSLAGAEELADAPEAGEGEAAEGE